MKLMICIPAHNEQNNIGGLVARCKRLYPEAEVVVVDDGSEDFTTMDARLAGATVLTNPPGSEYRDGFQRGMRYAIEKNQDCVVFMDAGNSYRPEEIAALTSTNAVITIGSRTGGSLLTRLGLATFRRLTGHPEADYCSFRAFRPMTLGLTSDGPMDQHAPPTAHEFNPYFAYLLYLFWGPHIHHVPVSYRPTNSNLRPWQLPGIAIRFAKFVWKENTRGS